VVREGALTCFASALLGRGMSVPTSTLTREVAGCSGMGYSVDGPTSLELPNYAWVYIGSRPVNFLH
jgi:hypothetical protein